MNLTPPYCGLHGGMAKPMLRPGCWWCPRGMHLVLTGTVVAPSISKGGRVTTPPTPSPQVRAETSRAA
jgi:hypothetical protein